MEGKEVNGKPEGKGRIRREWKEDDMIRKKERKTTERRERKTQKRWRERE